MAALSMGTLQAGSMPKNGTTTALTSVDCTGGGSETFVNIPASASSYATRTWTGDNSVAWSATDARTDQTLTGKAIALRASTLKNTSAVSGGVGTLTFKYARIFTGNSTLKVYVNGVQYGGDITVSSETASTFSYTANVAGNVTIEIKNSGNRVVVDDVAWTCYTVPVAGPELQLADAASVNKACGALAINYGSQAIDTYSDKVFYIKNTGTSNLTVSNLSLSNASDFYILSPSTPFTVSAAGMATVVVRFETPSTGVATSLLTITSNDTDEASCTVNLSGTGLESCVAPATDNADIDLDSLTATSVDVTVTNVTADRYLAILTNGTSLTGAPADAATYMVGDSLAGGIVAYNGSAAAFTLSGLVDSSDYNVYVFPYNTTNCAGGPVYAEAAAVTDFSTPVAPCVGGAETFSNLGSSSSAYATRTWTGDNGVQWTATDARTDQDLNGDAIGIREGHLTNTTPVNGGIGTLSFNYKRIFTGNSTLKVFVNGIQYGGDITVSSDSSAVFTQLIEAEGPVTINIVNSGNRIAIDDLVWDCYQIPEAQELQVVDQDGAAQTCGAYTLDFGSVALDTNGDATFTIKNRGIADLEISALTLNDTVNYTIVSPVTFPVVIDSLGTQQVIVRFNTGVPDTYPATLTIASNDTDEASCVVNLTAIALAECKAPDVAEGVIAISNETDTTADVAITGITADNYLVLLSIGGTVTAPANGTNYVVGDSLGSAVVAYVGSNASFTLADLTAETNYTLTVFASNNAACVNGPVYAIGLEDEINTIETPCVGGAEDFTNIPATSSAYATRTWTGNNGIQWTANDARTDQTLNGKAIGIRTGTLENVTPVTGGIGTLTFSYKRIFTGNSTLKVYVNGIQYGSTITVSLDTPVTFSQLINVSADATIEIENTGGNRIAIDDLAWDCYSGAGAKKAAPATTSLTNEVKLYPNPNKGQFQLELTGETADVAIYNMAGSLILNKTVSNNEMIDLGTASKGIYMVVITSEGTVSNKKIVVE